MPGLDVTLKGFTGTGIEVTARIALASTRMRPVAERVEYGIGFQGTATLTYGVGTTGDPFLTDAEWVLRSQIEDAHNPFNLHR